MSTTPAVTSHVTSMVRAEQAAAFSLFLNREVFPARAGWDARVDVLVDGAVIATLHIDRIDGEAQWQVSAHVDADCSMPRFMHGLFSRCTIPQFVAGEMAAQLDAAVAAATHAAGHQCPQCGFTLPARQPACRNRKACDRRQDGSK